MGALLEQWLSSEDLERILVTYVKTFYDDSCSVRDGNIKEFVKMFDDGEITFIELEDDGL